MDRSAGRGVACDLRCRSGNAEDTRTRGSKGRWRLVDSRTRPDTGVPRNVGAPPDLAPAAIAARRAEADQSGFSGSRKMESVLGRPAASSRQREHQSGPPAKRERDPPGIVVISNGSML